MSLPAGVKQEVKRFVAIGLVMTTLDMVWFRGLVGKGFSIFVIAAWCLWLWHESGWNKKDLAPILAGGVVIFALWLLLQYYRLWAYILVVPLIGFCGYMCWREKRRSSVNRPL